MKIILRTVGWITLIPFLALLWPAVVTGIFLGKSEIESIIEFYGGIIIGLFIQLLWVTLIVIPFMHMIQR